MQKTYILELDFLQGEQETALKNARVALADCRDVGMSFVGPKVLGGFALECDKEFERPAPIPEPKAIIPQATYRQS